MGKLIAVVLLSVVLGAAPVLAAEGKAGTPAKEATVARDMNRDMAMLTAGVLGLVLASGAAGLISTGMMIGEGMAMAEALEAGAGLPMPVALLSAVLGGMFGQDLVLRNFNFVEGGDASRAAH